MDPVREAARRNDVEELRRLLDEEPGLLEAEDNNPWRRSGPLHLACYGGCMEAACFLLDRGAAIDSRDDLGSTPLMQACFTGRGGVVRLLLARGADPALRDDDSWTALMEASCGVEGGGSDHVAVVRLLLEDGRVEIDASHVEGRTALWLACCNGYSQRVRMLLLEGGADHTIADDEGVTPMAMARQENRHETVRLLEWFEGELEKTALLSKARAVVDATESISKAPEKVGAKTRGEAERAREEAAPAYLRGRVERGEALPSVEVVEQAGGQEAEEEEEEVLGAVCEYLVRDLKPDLHIELMAGLRLR